MARVNGKEEKIDGLTISQLLQEKGFDERVVVVEINEEIVPKDTYGSHVINDVDVVEVVSFMGGG